VVDEGRVCYELSSQPHGLERLTSLQDLQRLDEASLAEAYQVVLGARRIVAVRSLLFILFRRISKFDAGDPLLILRYNGTSTEACTWWKEALQSVLFGVYADKRGFGKLPLTIVDDFDTRLAPQYAMPEPGKFENIITSSRDD
jgi:hypothetical protein